MDGVVASGAYDEGFSSPFCHGFRPWGRWPSRFIEVCEFPDVVHFHLASVAAGFASSGQEPDDQFLAPDGARGRLAVLQDPLHFFFQWLSTEPCDPGFPPVVFDAGLKAS